MSTFSAAVSVGIRLNPWKTKPISCARIRPSSDGDADDSSRPSSCSVPEVGVSSAPSSCSSVDLPPPVGPWIVTKAPGMISRSTPVSAVTVRPLRV